ncbi:MAG: hypothetical protein H8K09_15375 [Nitrospira sp.]|nr:hypothetical protein [Nitrospira sp.]
MLVAKRIMAVVFGFVPLALVAVGVVIALREVGPTDPLLYSVQQDGELTEAFMFAAVGGVGLSGCYRLWRTDAGWKWVLVPIGAMIFGIIVIPAFLYGHHYGHHGSPSDRASFNMFRRLGTFAGSSKQLAQEQGQFLCDPSVELFGPSRFTQNGQPLPYVIHCVLNATGPALATPPERPGTLVFAVSPDRKQAWFAATVLARRTDRHATWLTQQGQPRVIALSLQAEK